MRTERDPFTVRRLAPGEETTAKRVVERFMEREVAVEHLETFLADPKHHLFVAEREGAVAGFLLAYGLDRLDGQGPMLFLYEIEVAAEHRRQGIGSDLLAAALEIVKREGWKETFVLTERSNAGAVAFYESTGGRMAGGDDLLFVYEG